MRQNNIPWYFQVWSLAVLATITVVVLYKIW
jgi:hypothetical protein